MSLLYHLFYLITFILCAVLCDECDKKGILVYEDLGCTPEYADNKKCPVKYSCKGLEPSTDVCYFRGKSYTDGQQVDTDLSIPSCQIGCFCRALPAGSSFTCAILDCPEWLGGLHLDPGCYRKYSLDRCCSSGRVCPPFENNEKCTVEGQDYHEGQKFYPKNTCLKCVCQKGFKGKFEEPFCKRHSCGQQLRRFGANIQQSCAAFYTKKSDDEVKCCPDDWVCPNGSENIQGSSTSDESCKFGDKTLKVGKYFERSDFKDVYGRSFKKMKCECVVPPLVQCVEV